ncbi:hypothetical protein Stsp02_70510 [Streptomyces sp. NBRC 14336]|nr:hypothetical protein Stsp02_70510 [Streptomyces sp. NBRC 14336]
MPDDKPQRPLRPDEEEALARFHNGDTLDNIPVVRLPTRRARWWPLVAVVAGVGVVGGLVGAGVALFQGRGAQAQGGPGVSASPSGSFGGNGESSSPSAAASEAPPSVLAEPSPSGPEQVRVIQTPPTGGDPGASYCLVYTGSASGPEREAILLMNAPGYQCHDLLPFDPTGLTPAFTTDAPLCEAPSRAAVVNFAEVGGWEGELMYTCLTRHSGA